MIGVEEEWIEPLVAWARQHPEIEAVYLYGSRVSGSSHTTGEPFRPDSDLDVALRISDPFNVGSNSESALAVWMCEAQGWKEEAAALRLSVTLHLELASDDDDRVWPACQAYGVRIHQRPRMRPFRVPGTGVRFGIDEELWQQSGAAHFHPTTRTYVVAQPKDRIVSVVPIAAVRQPRRNPGAHPPYGLDNGRLMNVLREIVDGKPLDPLTAYRLNDPDDFEFAISDGFHRFHACVALEYSRLPLWVTDPPIDWSAL